jgi:AcrR family transcriptional regulator
MKQVKKERTQQEIIQAAKEIVRDKGHAAITVRSLAEATGYSYTILYYYYKDLHALLWTLRLEMIEDMIAELTFMPFSKEDPLEEILTAFSAYTDYFFCLPNVFRFFYFYPFTEPENDDRYQKLEQRLHGIWQTAFTGIILKGLLKSEDIEVFAETLIYALQGMILLSLSSNGSLNKEDVKNKLAKLVHYLIKNQKIDSGRNDL